ncbi:ATP-binding cassette domain-containing protein [Sphingobium sp. Ant17]|uniref:ATP-binding cassette domain-containing protein n=1 Tax=Sphingobium sp. Ant17 TaxID=1461752 RepID=UPI0004B9385D|nr:ATP-binding cassette domain-containing protein [Sphingobium sp. Ant17]
MTALIETRGLAVGYGSRAVVSGLALHVEPGEVVSLFGPNGAGKTTTLLTLAGALAPISGQVVLFGDVASSPLHMRVRQGLAS